MLTVSAFADAQDESRPILVGLQNRIGMGCNSYSWSCSNLLTFAAARAGLEVSVDAGVFVNLESGGINDPMIAHYAFGDIEVGDLVAWSLHFLNAHGSVTDEIVRVRRPSPEMPNAPCLDAFRRTDPKWATQQSALLQEALPQPDIKEPAPVGMWVGFLVLRAGIKNYIFRPGTPAEKRVRFPENIETFEDAVDALCEMEMADLQYRFISGVMLFERKEARGMHNQTGGR